MMIVSFLNVAQQPWPHFRTAAALSVLWLSAVLNILSCGSYVSNVGSNLAHNSSS